MKFYTRYNPPVDPGIRFDEVAIDKVTGEEIPLTPSMTSQSEEDASNINSIMKRFERTGVLPVKYSQPQFGDARIVDFQTARQLVIDAENQFMSLPSATRDYFHNSVEIYSKTMSKALSDGLTDAQAAEFLKLGIIVERQETDSQRLDKIASAIEKSKEVQK